MLDFDWIGDWPRGCDDVITRKEWKRRKQLDAIDKTLQEIENALIEVMPQENKQA